MSKPRRSAPISEGRSHSMPTVARPVRSVDPASDFQLIDRLLQRDPDAWRQFVERYQRLIFARVVRTLGGFNQQDDHALAEDVCADVFAQLLADNCAQLRRFEGRSKLSTWLDVIARRMCLRRLRQEQSGAARITTDASIESVEAGATDLSALQADEAQNVRAALQRLSDADRAVIDLFYFKQLTYRQIAAELNLSINTVGPKLQRAQTRLGKILNAGPTIRTAASDS